MAEIPNDVSRLHIDKNKWYDFHLLFRRDKNFWDYNLFENPLNPAALESGRIPDHRLHRQPSYDRTSRFARLLLKSRHAADEFVTFPGSDTPDAGLRSDSLAAIPRAISPGLFSLSRRRRQLFHNGQRGNAGNAGKQQLHDERLPCRSGHSPVSANDDLLRSVPQLFQAGQQLSGNPTATPQNYGYQLANGTPVDFGVVWSTQTPAEAMPCAAPIANAATNPPTANPSCNGFLSYSQVYAARNHMPTERLRLQSNYIQKLEVTASMGYSSSDNIGPGFRRSYQWPSDTIGDAREHHRGGRLTPHRVSVNADGSAVYAITDKFRVEDFYRYDNWRIPAMWATYETNLFGGAGSGAARTGAAVILIQPGIALNTPIVCCVMSCGALQPG